MDLLNAHEGHLNVLRPHDVYTATESLSDSLSETAVAMWLQVDIIMVSRKTLATWQLHLYKEVREVRVRLFIAIVSVRTAVSFQES